MNPDNPVVALCSQGMQAEAEGRDDDARDLFLQAWKNASDDYEACIAAHYLARHQPTAHDTLHWNRECLERADRVADDRVKGFYASLHLNMAHSHRDLGAPEEARAHFALAAERLADVPPGPYADGIRIAAAEGLRACGALTPSPAAGLLDTLAAALCERRDLKSLSLLLPPLLGDTGTSEDRLRLTTALHTLHAARALPDSEQDLLRRAVTALT